MSNVNSIKTAIKSTASEIAGGYMTRQNSDGGHHYEMSVEGGAVYVSLVFGERNKYRPRARWRFKQLAHKLSLAGYKVAFYDDGSIGVTGKGKAAAPAKAKPAAKAAATKSKKKTTAKRAA